MAQSIYTAFSARRVNQLTFPSLFRNLFGLKWPAQDFDRPLTYYKDDGPVLSDPVHLLQIT